MASQNEITEQQELLATHRRTLAHYLRQQAQLGSSQVTPGIVHGIYEAREQIRRIKNILQEWGVPAGHHPDDEASGTRLGNNFQESMKAESLQDQQRKALTLALDWIPVIQTALTQACSLISSVRQNSIDEEEYHRDFPNILAVLSRMDLPIQLSTVLPKGIYSTGIEIVNDFKKIKAMGLMTHTYTAIECGDAIYTIDAKIDNLYQRLKAEYIKTYC